MFRCQWVNFKGFVWSDVGLQVSENELCVSSIKIIYSALWKVRVRISFSYIFYSLLFFPLCEVREFPSFVLGCGLSSFHLLWIKVGGKKQGHHSNQTCIQNFLCCFNFKLPGFPNVDLCGVCLKTILTSFARLCLQSETAWNISVNIYIWHLVGKESWREKITLV